MSQARVAPSVRDGETRGFEFRGVKKDSLPQALGITNGDVVTSVNGNSLQSIDQVMGLVTKLRRASNLSITIERKGVTVNKEFEIR
jgi:general secretion pathway protein C